MRQTVAVLEVSQVLLDVRGGSRGQGAKYLFQQLSLPTYASLNASLRLIWLRVSQTRAIAQKWSFVHRPLGVDHAGEHPLEALEPQEARREAGAERRARAEVLRVERQQVVEQTATSLVAVPL